MESLFIMHPFDILNLDNGARLIFTPCPGTKEASLQASLKTLQAAGADAVVTMMPDAELSEFKADSLPAECAALGLAWFQLPVEDDCAPEAPFAAAFANHKADLLARLAAGQTLAIHCRGGSGRTGLMAAILLLEAGYAPAKVKAQVQGLRPKALTLTPHVNYLNTHYAFAG